MTESVEEPGIKPTVFDHPNTTARFLEKLTGQKPLHLHLAAQGRHCLVFGFELPQGKFCLKVAQTELLSQKAVWVKKYFQPTPLAPLIPRVYASGALQGEFWLIEGFVPGATPREMTQCNRAQAESFLHELGKQLLRLHAQPLAPELRGFGIWRIQAEKPDLSHLWPEWKSHLAQCHGQGVQAQAPVLRPDWLAWSTRLQQLLPYCPEKAYLIHGDLNLSNLRVSFEPDQAKIRGILDWVSSGTGDFVYDWASFLLHGPAFMWPLALRAWSEMYQAQGFDLSHLPSRLEAYVLHLALGDLVYLSDLQAVDPVAMQSQRSALNTRLQLLGDFLAADNHW